MALTVHIEYEAEIDEWINKYPCFSFIKNASVSQDTNHSWTINDGYWGYTDKTTYAAQIMIIGKTGYGKSTTLNGFVGKKVFCTGDVSVCTKDLYCAMYRINKNIPTFLMVSDLPGIGESNYADNHYYEWYKDMVERADVVVYVLRADQRDFAVDEILFKNLFKNTNARSKVILALNYADKVEPINRKSTLSDEQKINLKQKMKDVSRIFSFPERDIVYYSATDGVNRNNLIDKIALKLNRML